MKSLLLTNIDDLAKKLLQKAQYHNTTDFKLPCTNRVFASYIITWMIYRVFAPAKSRQIHLPPPSIRAHTNQFDPVWIE